MVLDSFWQHDSNFWFRELHSSQNGLSDDAAAQLLNQSKGTDSKPSRFLKDVLFFLGQFKSPWMLLLIGAVLLSFFLGDTSDVVIILFIVLSTGILSFFQERNAGRVVELLQSMIALKSDVVRNGSTVEILNSQLVSGDVVLFKAGDMVPADCLIIESNELNVNEASLTGESYPARKEAGVKDEKTPLPERTNCLWQGTNVVSGTAKAIVIHSGKATIFGSIVGSTQKNLETAFEKGIKDFGYFLLKITLALSVFILVVNSLNHKSILESALFALALAVGMAPELLPAIITIAMSAGARRLLKKKVIVKKLASIQNLGEVNLLCTDKTGTITKGTISVKGIVDSTGTESDYVKLLSFLNASLESGYGNPVNSALKKLKITIPYKPVKLGEIPYDFSRKRLAIAAQAGEEKLLISKGAYTQIVGICTRVRLSDGKLETFDAHRTGIDEHYKAYGGKGYRAIAVCYKAITKENIGKDDEVGMVFAGFVLLHDPVKPDIIKTIDELKKLKVELKIITGDNRIVAKAVAKKIGIAEPVVCTGKEIMGLKAEELKLKVASTHIFAEVEPQEK